MTTLDEIQARADAATEGPWRLWHDPSDPENRRGASVETAWSHDAGGEDTDLITDWCAPTDAVFIAHAREDVPKLVAALRAVEDWCETNQHPTADYPEGFSSQDYALDDAARRIRAAIREALG